MKGVSNNYNVINIIISLQYKNEKRVYNLKVMRVDHIDHIDSSMCIHLFTYKGL